MKKIDQATIDMIRDHVRENPSSSYKQVAISFAISEITVKRYCADLGRSKAWRRGKKNEAGDELKFWKSVDRREEGCWNWLGCKNNAGYGFLYYSGKSQAAHRLAYELTHTAISGDLELDHLCQNRSCCNPLHLEPVSRQENMKRIQLRALGTAQLQGGAGESIDTPTGTDTDTAIASDKGGIFTVAAPYINQTSIHSEGPLRDSPAVSIKTKSGSLTEGPDAYPWDSSGVLRRLSCLSDPFDLYSDIPASMARSGDTYTWLDADSHFQKIKKDQRDGTCIDRLSIAHRIDDATHRLGAWNVEMYWFQVHLHHGDPRPIVARSADEACLKVELLEKAMVGGRVLIKGWELICSDKTLQSFHKFTVRLKDGFPVHVVSTTEELAMKLVDEVWGPGHAADCTQKSHVNVDAISMWSKHWRGCLDGRYGAWLSR